MDYDSKGLEIYDEFSSTLDFSIGLGPRWDIDIQGNYRLGKATTGNNESEDLNHYDVRGLLRFALLDQAYVRLYAAGGAMYGQSDIPYQDWSYTSWSIWQGWHGRSWYTSTSTATILGGLLGGGVEISLNRLLFHANVLALLGGSSDDWNTSDCDIGEGTMISADVQIALTQNLRIGAYLQSESFGDGKSSIDTTTYGGMIGYAF